MVKIGSGFNKHDIIKQFDAFKGRLFKQHQFLTDCNDRPQSALGEIKLKIIFILKVFYINALHDVVNKDIKNQ